MLAVDCGSPPPTACRARSAATCSGVACFATAGPSPQKPRALMISAGVSGFGSVLALAGAAGFADLAAGTTCASADASWMVAASEGFERGTGTGSGDLAEAAATLTGAGLVERTGPPSSSSSLDLPLNSEASRLGLLIDEASSPLPRRSMSALASS